MEIFINKHLCQSVWSDWIMNCLLKLCEWVGDIMEWCETIRVVAEKKHDAFAHDTTHKNTYSAIGSLCVLALFTRWHEAIFNLIYSGGFNCSPMYCNFYGK